MSYEKAYVKWYGKHNKRLFITYLIVLLTLIVLPQLLFPYHPKQDQNLPLMLSCYIVFAVNIATAFAVPLYQFRYLMNKRSVDLFYPLPMKKATIFWLNYGIGAVLICIPNLLFFINVLWEGAAHDYIGFYVLIMSVFALLALVNYALVCFFVMKCNSLWDACFAACAVLIVQVLLASAVTGLLNDVTNELLVGGGNAHEFFPLNYIDSSQAAIAGFLWLNDAFWAFYEANMYGTDFIQTLFADSTLGIPMLLYYAVLLVSFSCLSARAYIKRKSEDSEQKTTSKLVFPLFISLITGSLLIYNVMDLSFFWFTIVAFFLMNALSERRLVIHGKMVATLIVYVVVLFMITKLLVETNGFGRIHEFYDPGEIRAVRMELYDYQNTTAETTEGSYVPIMMNETQRDVELIEKLVKLHHQTAEDPYHIDYEEIKGNVMICYELNNGMNVYRYLRYIDDDEKLIHEIKEYIIAHRYAEAAQ